MDKVVISTILVLIVIFVIPIIVYGIFSSLFGLKTPEGSSPIVFLSSVFVTKFGTSLAFVILFYLGRGYFSENWIQYAFCWWLMYVIGEIGQAIVPTYSWKEAVAGIISETLYFPISAYILHLLIRV